MLGDSALVNGALADGTLAIGFLVPSAKQQKTLKRQPPNHPTCQHPNNQLIFPKCRGRLPRPTLKGAVERTLLGEARLESNFAYGAN